MLIAFLCLCVSSCWFCYNLYRPITRNEYGAALSFAAGMLVGELTCHFIVLQCIFVLLFTFNGVVVGLSGALGLLLLFMSWGGMLYHYLSALKSDTALETSLQEALGKDYRRRIHPSLNQPLLTFISVQRVMRPFHSVINPKGIICLRNIQYSFQGATALRLDIRRSRSCSDGCPVLFQIHGGAWSYPLGSKEHQALPLMNYLAAHGWVCVTIEYRLSPRAKLPEHIIDCKRALVWVKENIVDYGGNPDFIVGTGGSAGGHLASLLALTANAPEFQPGFEQADTRLQGCVPFYGIYDLFDKQGLYVNAGLERWLESVVIKVPRHRKPELYQQLSPLYRIHPEAPPFLIVQGDKDSLAHSSGSRYFAQELKRCSNQPVAYVEIPGAQHAFELFNSLRTESILPGVSRFLDYLYRDFLNKTQSNQDCCHQHNYSNTPIDKAVL